MANNQYSTTALEANHTPPHPPQHDFVDLRIPIEVGPSRSMQRSKTVRNLGNAGSRVRGFFKKQNSKEVDSSKPTYTTRDEPQSFSAASTHRQTRPLLPSSSSYGPNSQFEQDNTDLSRPPSHNIERTSQEKDSAMDTRVSQSSATNGVQNPTLPTDKALVESAEPLTPEAAELMREIEQVNASITRAKQEIEAEAEKKQTLQTELDEARRVFQAREMEYTQVEHSFFAHTRAIRATDDDLSTIRDSFKLLKYSITRVIMTLNKKADRAIATECLVAAWPNLNVLDPNSPTKELESAHINLLAEKKVHEHLVQSVFRCPIYPGLSVNESFAALNEWLISHDSKFNVRLRQQLASIVAKNSKEGVIYQAGHAEKKRIADMIYNDIADIYAPFVRENDAAVEEDKRYSTKITDIVDKAMRLVVAIRGQDVDISTLDIEEGKQAFDEETMIDVKGKTTGTIRFCICPVFVGGDGEHGFLEKGKVVVGSS
ncbi:hypothetical protein CLU79DRAFT_31232 [Phycomyces nitens]|nr:hypothetical protein CLU79DRAFT_31232 [Phycomyces nitens]